jgi:ribosomal protein L35
MSGALGLIGGVPGLVMLGRSLVCDVSKSGAGRRSAQEYASQLMKSVKSRRHVFAETDNAEKRALCEQNLIDEQKSKIEKLKEQIAGYQSVISNPGGKRWHD